MRSSSSFGTGSGLSRRIARMVRMTSNRGASSPNGPASAIAPPTLPRLAAGRHRLVGQPASSIQQPMASTRRQDLENERLLEREHWENGPPHKLFSEMRQGCPVHWTDQVSEYPGQPGFWSVTTADDVHTVSRDWQTYSSERKGITALGVGFPLELIQAMFIGMDPPKHDRIKALFQAGFTPKRIAAHEDEIRTITQEVLDRLDGRETCDLVNDVAQPVVSRVIGSFMGIPPEDDGMWARLMNATLGLGDPDLNPEGVDAAVEKYVPEIFARCGRMIAERRENPTDDLTSVLVHAEIDGQRLEEHEIVMGFFLLVAAGNDSTKA